MDYRILTAPCGMECFNCPSYTAEAGTNPQECLPYLASVEKKGMTCRGCRAENGYRQTHDAAKVCSVYYCAVMRDVQFCCECPKYPCQNLKAASSGCYLKAAAVKKASGVSVPACH